MLVQSATAFGERSLKNALNAKVWTFYLVAFLLVSIHAAINGLKFGVMARLTQVASNGTVQRWLKGVTGTVFLGFGAKLATVWASV